jgi:transposase InsO family protein
VYRRFRRTGDIWKETDVIQERMRYVVQAQTGTRRLHELAEGFGIHRSTGWRWRRRIKRIDQIEAFRDLSRRPQRSPKRTDQTVTDRILELRQKHGWGALKIQFLLTQEKRLVSVATVNRILKREGAQEREDPVRPARLRFEREAPNQLWQMDFKGVPDATAGRYGKTCPLSVLDDHSRFAIGLWGLPSQGTEETWACLAQAFQTYGVPDAMLMDHGVPWWSTSNGHGLTRLSVGLMKHGIRLYFSGIRHPQTQGKVERFHRTMQERLENWRGQFPGWQGWLDEFRREYNELRPHQALAMATPAQRYHPSKRAYNPEPAEWDYGPDADVRRLNSEGCMKWLRDRYYVCEALAKEHVCAEKVGTLLWVRYRDTYVREIDLSSGKTRSILLSE